MENKNNISKEEFLKLFNSNEPKDLEHLDDFEKEALEGLKMMKNPSLVNTIDTKIDKKLEEIIKDEKGERRTGLYILSIAASLVLLVGLFFIFNNTNSEIQNEVAVNKEKNKPELNGVVTEEQAVKSNSDAELVTKDKEPVSDLKSLPAAEKKPGTPNKDILPLEQTIVYSANDNSNLKKESEGYISNSNDNNIVAPVANGETVNDEIVYTKNKEKVVVEEANKFDLDDVKLTEVSVKKEEEKDIKGKASKKTTETKNRAITIANNEVPAMSPVAGSNTTTTTFNNTNTGGVSYGNANNNTIVASSVSANQIKAEFKGGKTALNEYIRKKLIIPASCVSEEVIIIKFNVSASGKINKPKIASKTGNCKDCETEALNFVKNMPDWIPATENGKAIESKQQIELHFKK